jgi:hypothetical protein
MSVNKSIFNAYVIAMMKAAGCFNRSHRQHMGNHRRSYWSQQYFRYAKRGIKLAWQLPQEHRIHFERFLIYNRTQNKQAFSGTLEQARAL